MSTTKTNFRRITTKRIRTVEVPRGRKTSDKKVTLNVKTPHRVVKTPEAKKDAVLKTETTTETKAQEKEEINEEVLATGITTPTAKDTAATPVAEAKQEKTTNKRTRRNKRVFTENSTET